MVAPADELLNRAAACGVAVDAGTFDWSTPDGEFGDRTSLLTAVEGRERAAEVAALPPAQRFRAERYEAMYPGAAASAEQAALRYPIAMRRRARGVRAGASERRPRQRGAGRPAGRTTRRSKRAGPSDDPGLADAESDRPGRRARPIGVVA